MEPAEARPTGTEMNLLVSISFWQKGPGDASMADLCCCYCSVLRHSLGKVLLDRAPWYRLGPDASATCKCRTLSC